MADEEVKKPEEEGKEEETEDKPEEASSSIDEARAVVKELKEQNAVLNENLKRAEKMEADAILNGRAEGGAEKAKPRELTDKEYSDKVMAGEMP